MYDYSISNELARLTIILGIVVSTIIYKRTGLTLGGVIICGYLALFVGQPLHIIVTLAIAYLTYQIVYKILQKRFMLNGRKLFEIEILVGLIFQVLWITIIRLFVTINIDLTILYGIGFVLPGVIAHDMGRQGARNTIGSILLGVSIVALIIFPLSAIEEVLPNLFVRTSPPLLHTQPYTYTYPIQLLPLGIIVSVFLDLLAYSKFKVRSGGFVTAAYLAKLGMMILSGVVISWVLEIIIINLTHGLFVPWSGFVIIMPTIASLIANDFAREGAYPTVVTTSLATAGVWLIMQGAVLMLSQTHLEWLFLS